MIHLTILIFLRQPLQIRSQTLRFLDISFTQFTTILIDCPNLEILDFSGNRLTCENLNENIRRMPRLLNFWARSHNNLTPYTQRYKSLRERGVELEYWTKWNRASKLIDLKEFSEFMPQSACYGHFWIFFHRP